MKKLLEKSILLILFPVVFSLAASVAAFVWGAVKSVSVIVHLAASRGADPAAGIELIALMDTFLIATALLIFSLALYELFVEDLKLPDWLVVHDLHDLKAKLASVIILVMAVVFLEHLVAWNDPQGTLFYGTAISVVSASLIAYGHFGGKN